MANQEEPSLLDILAEANIQPNKPKKIRSDKGQPMPPHKVEALRKCNEIKAQKLKAWRDANAVLVAQGKPPTSWQSKGLANKKNKIAKQQVLKTVFDALKAKAIEEAQKEQQQEQGIRQADALRRLRRGDASDMDIQQDVPPPSRRNTTLKRKMSVNVATGKPSVRYVDSEESEESEEEQEDSEAEREAIEERKALQEETLRRYEATKNEISSQFMMNTTIKRLMGGVPAPSLAHHHPKLPQIPQAYPPPHQSQ